MCYEVCPKKIVTWILFQKWAMTFVPNKMIHEFGPKKINHEVCPKNELWNLFQKESKEISKGQIQKSDYVEKLNNLYIKNATFLKCSLECCKN